MSNVVVSVSARTDIGRQRAGNEDAFLVADLTAAGANLESDENSHTVGERGSLLVVSDGMGGAAAGEIASELAVTTVRESLVDLPLDLDVSDRLILAAQSANAKIWNHARENPELTGMGATLTAVLVQEASAFIAQVGDSRAYLLRGDEIQQLTKDQSLAQLLIEAGMIEPENVSRVPQNVIMQALGTQPDVRVAVTSVELSSQDGLLLCSDGLSNKIDEREMLEIVRESADLAVAAGRLIEVANERGGEDNITVILARFDGEAMTQGNSISGSVRAVSEDFFSEEAMSAIAQIPAVGRPVPPGEEVPTVTMPALTPDETEALAADSGHDSSGEEDAETLESRAVDSAAGRPRRIGYDVILLLAFISFLLLIGAAYFFYVYYLKRPPVEPIPVNTTSHF